MGCGPTNQSREEFESKVKNRGAAGNLGRLPGGGGFELGLEEGSSLATPLLRPDAENYF